MAQKNQPNPAPELQLIGSLLAKGDVKAAKARCDTLVRSHPRSADAFRFLALIDRRLGDAAGAHAAISEALKLDPSDPVSRNIEGVLLIALGRVNEALAAFERALAERTNFVPALINRGNALLDLNRPSEALDSFDAVLRIEPINGEATLHRGRALQALGKADEALESFTRATRLNPRLVEARLLRAESLRASGRASEALREYDAVLSFDANNKLALQNSATLLHMAEKLDVAAARYERLIRLLLGTAFGAELDYGLGNAVACRRAMCAWPGLAALEAQLVERVRNGEAAIKPILSLMIVDDPAIQRLCATRTWERQFGKPESTPLQRGARHDRLRIGYVCGDFREHPTAWLIAGLIERHDRERFDVRGYSSGPDDGSQLRQRLIRAFDQFSDIAGMNDEDAAAQIARDEIDILVDLNGITDFGRGGVIVRRPAPIVAHFLGYPGPMGTAAVDYLIADGIVIPNDRSGDYDCAIVRLPNSYQVNDAARERPSETATRASAGLPEDAIVFCGFAQPQKLSPDVFDVWMRILTRVPKSVLWLLEANEFIAKNLRQEAGARGVDPQRLIFAPRVGQAEHIDRHRLADVLLDTWPCGAHTSASDALWVGVPIVTYPGTTFASRVAASVVSAMGLPELVVSDLKAYEDLAVALGQSPARLCELKHKIAAHRTTQPLFDTNRFCRNIESAYAQMWSRDADGEPAQSFDVRE